MKTEDKVRRIGVISDTHGLLRREVTDVLETCDVILHSGDVGPQKILKELRKIACVYAVLGNNDQEYIGFLPEELSLELFGLRIYMIHDKKQISGGLEGQDLIVSGHSHCYEERREGGRLWLNPGSCGPRRFRLPVTMALIETEGGKGPYTVKRLEWTHSTW